MIDSNGPAYIDALGRSGFARELLEVVRVFPAEGGAVIGLEGEWGSGKTWVLDRLDSLNDELREEQQVLFLRFNPWMVSGSAEIVETFLIQLASGLGTTNRRSSLEHGAKIASKLIEYTGVLSTVKHLAPVANLLLPGSGLLVEAAAHAASAAASAAKEVAGGTIDRWKKEPGKLSLAAARKEVTQLLESAERRIAVLVDDLDRLPPAELAAMVQAIKAVADFPNVVYVLAYDPEAASHALESALRLLEGAGRRYLEKIVQFSMPVPEVPAFKMQRFAADRLRQALGSVDAADENDLADALPLAAALMRSPRDVLRLATRMELSSRRLVSEVSPADVLLAEALNLKAPDVIEYVHQHQRVMLRISVEGREEGRMERGELGDLHEITEGSRGISPWQRREEEWKAHRVAIEERIPERGLVVPLRRAVAYLFDAVPRDLHFNLDAHASRHRIQKLRNWSRWRWAVRHEEVFENSEVMALLRQPREIKHSRAWASSDSFLEFCGLAAELAGETDAVDAIAFVELFVEAARHFGEQPLLYEPEVHRFGPQHALVALIRSDRVGAVRAVERLIATGSVWLSQHIVWTVCAQTLGVRDRDVVPTDNPLVGDKVVAADLVQRWRGKALDWLRQVSEPIQGRPACHLATWMYLMGGDAVTSRNELTRLVEQHEQGLEICFCDPYYSDSRIERSGLSDWEILPEPDILKAARSRSPGFEEDHKLLLNWTTSPAPEAAPPTSPVDATPTTPDAPAPATASAPALASPAASPPSSPLHPPPAPPAPPLRDR